MKTLLLGLLGAVAIAAPVQAQSYDPFPARDCGGTVVNFICHDRGDDGMPMLYAIPDGYSGRYVIFASKMNDGVITFMYDMNNEQAAAWMFLGGTLGHMPNAGGNIVLLEELEAEIVDLATQVSLYY